MVFLNAVNSQYSNLLFDFLKISFYAFEFVNTIYGVNPVATCLLLRYIKKMFYSSTGVARAYSRKSGHACDFTEKGQENVKKGHHI